MHQTQTTTTPNPHYHLHHLLHHPLIITLITLYTSRKVQRPWELALVTSSWADAIYPKPFGFAGNRVWHNLRRGNNHPKSVEHYNNNMNLSLLLTPSSSASMMMSGYQKRNAAPVDRLPARVLPRKKYLSSKSERRKRHVETVRSQAFYSIQVIDEGFEVQPAQFMDLTGFKNLVLVCNDTLRPASSNRQLLQRIDMTGVDNLRTIGNNFFSQLCIREIKFGDLSHLETIGDNFLAFNPRLRIVEGLETLGPNLEKIMDNFLRDSSLADVAVLDFSKFNSRLQSLGRRFCSGTRCVNIKFPTVVKEGTTTTANLMISNLLRIPDNFLSQSNFRSVNIESFVGVVSIGINFCFASKVREVHFPNHFDFDEEKRTKNDNEVSNDDDDDTTEGTVDYSRGDGIKVISGGFLRSCPLLKKIDLSKIAKPNKNVTFHRLDFVHKAHSLEFVRMPPSSGWYCLNVAEDEETVDRRENLLRKKFGVVL